jgi:hypothetical protein
MNNREKQNDRTEQPRTTTTATMQKSRSTTQQRLEKVIDLTLRLVLKHILMSSLMAKRSVISSNKALPKSPCDVKQTSTNRFTCLYNMPY